LRAELAREGIVVVTVVPGLMRTGSYVNAFFKGKAQTEYTLFSLLANSPLSSMSDRRAARQIVQATRRGDAEVILTLQAQVMARLHGLAPGLSTDLLALANRVLPGADGDRDSRLRGKDAETPLSRSFLNVLGQRAGRELNQYPEQGQVPAVPSRG
jgi:NAD(P)-dependent dehydrogenase (short-subunit alcohol dehydrogenase family)